MNPDRDFVVALARGLDVLACFGPRATSLSLTGIAARTQLPKATVSRIAYTLMEMGYLRQNAAERSYSLGPAVLALGNPVLSSLPLRQMAQPLMRELAERFSGTVSMGVFDRDRVVYVETARSAPNPDHIPDIGSIWPVMESAIGRAILAAMPADERTRTLNSIKVNDPGRWKLQRPQIEEALRDYARYGYCVSLQEIREGFLGVGVPLATPYMGNRIAFNCAVQAADPTGKTLRRKVAPALVEMVGKVHRLMDGESRRQALVGKGRLGWKRG